MLYWDVDLSETKSIYILQRGNFMNILVIGCDQVGASLVRDLERIGHDISIIEKDSEQLKRLDAFDDYTF
ncbi:MAG: NAD-binding protein, partial [Faecalibacterium prausnitzii]|nr:NAD-binding protein [Faecalibacterium prausnitzii]